MNQKSKLMFMYLSKFELLFMCLSKIWIDVYVFIKKLNWCVCVYQWISTVRIIDLSVYYEW